MKKLLLIIALIPGFGQAQQRGMQNMNMSKSADTGSGKRVEYFLNVTDTMVTFAKGKLKPAISINGTIPAPTLYFTEGDTAVIHVKNLMQVETSVHWHGLLLPNVADGVPYLTTPPIEAGSTYTFSFPVIQNGTYWYHSHTGLQEQVGLYGPIVIYPKNKRVEKEKVILFADWTNESMSTVVRSLKANYEWYGIKRKSVQSWGEALVKGYLGDKAKQEWSRMPPMDVSDVYYNAFLANGRQVTEYPEFKAGETVRLRLINGGAGTYFWVQFAGGPMTIIAADGKDVEPVKVDKIDFPIAETYDVLITIPAEGAYELRATSADISGHSSVYFGSGKKIDAPDIPKLNYFAMLRERNKMDMGSAGKDGSMPGMDMQQQKDSTKKMNGMDMGAKKESPSMPGMDMPGMKMENEKSAGALTYDMLRSVERTAFDKNLPVREVPLTLTGNMLRYIWSFDDKPLSKADKIMIKKGEVVRFKMFNNTMMRHPMHLHGHFFRFLNAQGEYAPLKHTFDIQPMETVTIEFLANEEQDWFFHCHILYHMATGMARIVSYEGSEQNEFAKTGYKVLKKEDNFISKWADLNVLSNGAWLEGFVSNNKNQLRFDGRVNWKGDYETETHLLRFLDKRDYLAAFIGYDNRLNGGGIKNTKDNRKAFEAGLLYLLPFFIETELRVDQTGRLRAQLQRRDMPITTRLFFDGRVNTDKEYTLGLRYFVTRTFSISTLHDSDYGTGAGISIRY
ncbi:multicopper oxidase domain-containing protein [Daejeonella sp.]|uniref:multicopper oxidase domain-containing protein n=1 Tax=Daejeonella sp. TaxID=2805397 RepID=UPI00272FAF58|nr:multicopper oxidase domain-containing protein [Daejeonella sp.]MDP2412743.1 multicopper oxidase domain-containing protein [Daejeonella sp.]